MLRQICFVIRMGFILGCGVCFNRHITFILSPVSPFYSRHWRILCFSLFPQSLFTCMLLQRLQSGEPGVALVTFVAIRVLVLVPGEGVSLGKLPSTSRSLANKHFLISRARSQRGRAFIIGGGHYLKLWRPIIIYNIKYFLRRKFTVIGRC